VGADTCRNLRQSPAISGKLGRRHAEPNRNAPTPPTAIRAVPAKSRTERQDPAVGPSVLVAFADLRRKQSVEAAGHEREPKGATDPRGDSQGKSAQVEGVHTALDAAALDKHPLGVLSRGPSGTTARATAVVSRQATWRAPRGPSGTTATQRTALS